MSTVSIAKQMPTSPYRHRWAVSVPLALVVCMGLAACGDSSNGSEGAITSTGTTTTALSGGFVHRTATLVKAARLSKPASRQRLAQFAACLRRNGIKTHALNAIAANGAQHRAAEAKCSSGSHRAIFRPIKPPEAPSSGTPHGVG
ncbi:MAG: hypothetical protein WBV77_07940 [Solirubrobacteraceae bacterium]|jgi:hypothetical protein